MMLLLLLCISIFDLDLAQTAIGNYQRVLGGNNELKEAFLSVI